MHILNQQILLNQLNMYLHFLHPILTFVSWFQSVDSFFMLRPKVFEGNNDGDTVVSHWLVQPVKARYFRLQPKTWNEQIALRVELYGNTAPGN